MSAGTRRTQAPRDGAFVDDRDRPDDPDRRRAFMPPAPTFGEENSGALRAAPTEDIVEIEM
jgi:hypothetical protein